MTSNDSSRATDPQYPWIDLMRGGAALLVLLEHARAFTLVDLREIGSPTPIDLLLYLVSGLGHQAVIIFFVLSGFCIGNSVTEAAKVDRLSWGNYAMARLSRLWLVLIPALLFTLIVDKVAIEVTGSSFYSGRAAFYHSGPPSGGADYDAQTFAGNLFFLQTIAVNVFGSNGPLWSLANEFWYYILFPLAYVCLGGDAAATTFTRIVTAGLFLSLCFSLPSSLVALGLVWIVGLVACLLKDHAIARAAQSNVGRIVALAGFAGTVLVARAAPIGGIWSDYLVGVAAGILIVAFVKTKVNQRLALVAIDGVSRFSYSLYLFHFPLLASVAAVLWSNERLAPGLTGYWRLAVSIALAVAVSAGAYWLFERNTFTLRNRMKGLAQQIAMAARL